MGASEKKILDGVLVVQACAMIDGDNGEEERECDGDDGLLLDDEVKSSPNVVLLNENLLLYSLINASPGFTVIVSVSVDLILLKSDRGEEEVFFSPNVNIES